MHDFADAFAKRDEIKCSRIAIELVHIVNWSEDRTVFLAYMPQHNRDLSSQWVIHSIGTQILSALPIPSSPALFFRTRDSSGHKLLRMRW